MKWFKSSFSMDSMQCVEVARPNADEVHLRDTKDRSKPAHIFTDGEWDAFVKGVKAGEFDLPA